mgnify:CR=1 FL=1
MIYRVDGSFQYYSAINQYSLYSFPLADTTWFLSFEYTESIQIFETSYRRSSLISDTDFVVMGHY